MCESHHREHLIILSWQRRVCAYSNAERRDVVCPAFGFTAQETLVELWSHVYSSVCKREMRVRLSQRCVRNTHYWSGGVAHRINSTIHEYSMLWWAFNKTLQTQISQPIQIYIYKFCPCPTSEVLTFLMVLFKIKIIQKNHFSQDYLLKTSYQFTGAELVD